MSRGLPKDAKIIYDANCWLIFYSESEKSIYFDTSDYHPEPFQLTPVNLTELIQIIEGKNSDDKKLSPEFYQM